MKKKIIIAAAVVVLAGAGVAAYVFLNRTDTPQNQSATQQPAKESFNKSKYSITEPGSPWWIVNKQRPIADADYAPGELVAPNIKLRWAAIAESMQVSKQIAPSLEAMYKASQAAGFDLMLISGYRSAATQKELHDSYVAQYGQAEANRFSARPGTSEHQTGLVVDLGRADKNCELEACFGETAEGKWLAAHAHEFGFIIRYPQGKEAIVGYQYEPWHLRYVGPELAAELFATKQTMEEFFINR